MPESSIAERMMLTVSEIVKRLIEAHEEGKDVNLNRLDCVRVTLNDYIIAMFSLQWLNQ